MLKVALLLALVAAVSAQKFRCKTPQQWMARRTEFKPNMYRDAKQTWEYRTIGRFAYDGINQRTYFKEEYGTRNGENIPLYTAIYLDGEKTCYYIDQATGACHAYNTTAEDKFLPLDIPEYAQFDGYMYLGSYPEQLELSQWSFQFPPGPSSIPVDEYLTYDSKSCVPVRHDQFSREVGFQYEEFSDVTLGISDPNIWTPPTNCTFPGSK